MTTPGATTFTAPPLLRRRDDSVVRGVCAAFGRSTDTDPVLWRVVVAVLTVFGGTGLLLYAAGWLLIPEQGADGSIAARLLHRRRELSRTAVAALVGAAVLLLVAVRGRVGALPVVAVGLLVYVVLRGQPGRLRLATREEAAAPTATDPAGAVSWSRTGRRERSPLGLLTMSAAVVVTGVLLGLHAAGADSITLGRLLAADLGVVGLGLVVGAVRGRSRWLVLPAVLIAVALAATAGARVPVALSAGQRTWVAAGDHRLGFGDATLDVHGPGTAEVGAGQLTLHLPAGLHVEVTAATAAGQVALPDEPTVNGTRLQVVRTYGPADAPLVRVHAALGAGALRVIRDAA